MLDAYEVHKQAIEAVKAAGADDEQIMRMVQYFTEEAPLVSKELAAAKQYRNIIEAIHTLTGQALERR